MEEKPKKVMIISNATGGLYIFRKRLIEALQEKGCKVVILSVFTSRAELLKETGAEVIETPFDQRGISLTKETALYSLYNRYIKDIQPDLIITYTIKPNIFGGLAAQKRHIPYTANITGLGTVFQREGILNKASTILYRAALRKAKNVFFENSSNREYFVGKRIVNKEKTVVLPGAGVDLREFGILDYPQDSNTVHFIFIGRIMKEKGIQELFGATKRLYREKNSIRLTVVGGFEEHYQDTIKAYEEEGWLRYIGYVTDVRPYIKEAHCAVLPSYHEGMSNTNLECAASGRPLITSNIPGCKEAVIEGVTGLLCEPRNEESLYAAMKQMLEMRNEDRREMGIAGRRHMEEEFDKERVVNETIRHLLQ